MASLTSDKLPTERQRWMAAQWLARGQCVVRAAAFGSLPPRQLRELLHDEDFRELIEAEREQLALSPEDWQREMDGANRQAIERALADGRVSVVGQLLRLGLALPALAKQAGSRQAAEQALRDLDEEDERDDDEDDDNANFLESDDGVDDAAWLAGLPVVEADSEREAERRRALMRIGFRQVRRLFGAAPLARIEKHLVCADPVAYEEWFARQPKPPRNPAKSLTAEDAALVERVTRHNPPWIRGPYLGYHRPPVPAHLFLPGATGDEPAAPTEPVAAAPETPAALRARILRLLDRSQPRLAEELDLAEAICAVRWPNWPEYHGPIDLDLLRLALEPIAIDAATLHWLDSHELARACRSTAVEQPQGP